jgi:hypothetical protein
MANRYADFAAGDGPCPVTRLIFPVAPPRAEPQLRARGGVSRVLFLFFYASLPPGELPSRELGALVCWYPRACTRLGRCTLYERRPRYPPGRSELARTLAVLARTCAPMRPSVYLEG